MSNAAIAHLPRWQRKNLLEAEAVWRRRGDWGAWETIPLPSGVPGANGWSREVKRAYRNRVFSVLERPITGATHLAVSSLSGVRPTWHEMQRIKNELAGEDATGVEVYPPHSEMVDEADMFHLWIVAPLPFTIAYGDRDP